MLDVIFVGLMLVLAVVAWAFVVACDKLLGSDEAALRDVARDDPDTLVGSKRRAA